MDARPAYPLGESEHVVRLSDLLWVIWRRSWLVLLVIVVVVGATMGFSLTQTPLYEASIKVLIGQEQDSVPEGLGSEIPGLQQLTLTMTEAVNTQPVAEGVIRELDLEMSSEDFLKDLSVEQVGSTTFIEVTYTDPNPRRVQQIANTIGEVFSRKVAEVSPSTNSITATIWEPAVVPEGPVSPNIALNALLALIAGAMLGVGLALVLEHLDDSWRSPEEAEQISGTPTLAAIPWFELPKVKKRKG
jgi:capsular polysaccharide biosynthesis protein